MTFGQSTDRICSHPFLPLKSPRFFEKEGVQEHRPEKYLGASKQTVELGGSAAAAARVNTLKRAFGRTEAAEAVLARMG